MASLAGYVGKLKGGVSSGLGSTPPGLTPLAGIEVDIFTAGTVTPRLKPPVISDRSGRWIFSDLSTGNYDIAFRGANAKSPVESPANHCWLLNIKVVESVAQAYDNPNILEQIYCDFNVKPYCFPGTPDATFLDVSEGGYEGFSLKIAAGAFVYMGKSGSDNRIHLPITTKTTVTLIVSFQARTESLAGSIGVGIGNDFVSLAPVVVTLGDGQDWKRYWAVCGTGTLDVVANDYRLYFDNTASAEWVAIDLIKVEIAADGQTIPSPFSLPGVSREETVLPTVAPDGAHIEGKSYVDLANALLYVWYDGINDWVTIGGGTSMAATARKPAGTDGNLRTASDVTITTGATTVVLASTQVTVADWKVRGIWIWSTGDGTVTIEDSSDNFSSNVNVLFKFNLTNINQSIPIYLPDPEPVALNRYVRVRVENYTSTSHDYGCVLFGV